MAAEQDTSGAPGRPLPHFEPAPPSTPTKHDEGLDSDDSSSGGGRRHMSASVSKTSFSVDTPASKKAAIQRLRQSLTYSDNSSHSSAASTPEKNGPTQSGQGSTHSLQSSTQSAPPTFGTGRPGVLPTLEPPGDEGEGSEYVSEGEVPSEISITAIMSKLEQVKNYLQEAQALHQQMKERLSEPGMAVQVNKMGRLVEDLRRQESGYLSILVKLLDQHKGGGPGASSSQVGAADSEGSGSEGDTPSDTEIPEYGDHEGAGEKGNDCMSLKAELLKERMEAQYVEKEKQDEELAILRQQRDLLRKLVEQQKQIETLEARQKSLLLDGTAATTIQQSAGAGEVLVDGGSQPTARAAVAESGGDDDETTESAVVRRLQQLRERQARVEQLTTLLQQLKTDSQNERQSQVPTSSSAPVVGGTPKPKGGGEAGELVAVGTQAIPAELLELQQKLRQAQEAREKLAELQQMISLLQEADGEGDEEPQPHPPATSRQTREDQLEQQREEEEGEGEEEEEGQTESRGELEASVLSEYEERVVRRRREVRELQEQRDRLLATQMKLQQLQQSIVDNGSPSSGSHTAPSATRDLSANAPSDGVGGVLSSEELASELGRQRRLYDELLDKTQQIQSMVDEVTGARDMSGATWGGSSSEEEEEDDGEEGVTSSVATAGLNDTRDDLENTTFTGTLGESAVVVVGGDEEEQPQREGGGGERREGEGEEVVFRVTRHTPRHLRGGQRRVHTSPHLTSQHSAGKRMRLDDTSPAPPRTSRTVTVGSGVKAPPPPPPRVSTAGVSSGCKPSIGSLSAAWPGVIFPSSASRKHTRDETTQTCGGTMGQQQQQGSLTDTHMAFLQHQMASTSALASQLLVSQQTLVGSVCRQLETQALSSCFQEHFARLHHYQAQLEQQYQQLQAAFYKLEVAAEEREQEEEEDGEETDRYREEPVFHARPPSPQPPFTLTTAPPHHQSNNTRGRPSQDSNEKRERDDSEQPATGPTVAGSRPRPSDPRKSWRMPPPPGAYLPHLYQPQPPAPPDRREPESEREEEEEGVSVDEGLAAGYFPPPPPLPPYFHHPLPYYHYPPPPPPHIYPPWAPPLTPHLGGHNMSFPHLQPSPAPTASPLPPHPNTYPNLRLSWPPPPHYPGVSSIYPGHTPHDSFMGLNSSGHYMFGPGGYPPPHIGGPPGVGGGYGGILGGGRGGGHNRPFSPSGVTGVSMQVQPPSSPPSAPSVTNLLQNSSLAGPNTGSGLLLQSSSVGTLLAPVQSGPPPSSSIPTLTPHGDPHTLTTTNHPLSSTARGGAVGRPGQEDGAGKEGEKKKKVTGSQLARGQDEESISSLPLSLPDEASKTGGEGGISVFDTLRDTIYSEVATLIANNENRPHFLVELFRELQMLSSDYLRQRALYSLQDLVTRYLTEEGVQGRTTATAPGLELSWSEQTPSESLVTSDDEFVRAARGGREEEEEESASTSTPPRGEPPFVSDTVVRLDKAMARLRGSCGPSVGEMEPPVVSPGPLQTTQQQPHISSEELDEQIKATMTEVIPLLKGHMAKSCSPELLQEIRQLVMKLTLTQLKKKSPSIVEPFTKQLDSALENSLQKYLNQMLKECGEALLVEVSEVLFNELAFFRLVQTMDGKKEPELEGTTFKEEREGDGAAEVLPVLQALTTAVEKTLSEEQEALGKTRDDELAREWSGPQDRPSSPSLDEDQTIIVKLSASESKPIESVSSGEEGEGGGGGGEGGGKASSVNSTTTGPPSKNTGEREETPPTPVVSAVTATGGGSTGLSTQSPLTEISTDTNVEAQMKLEQQSTGGVAGILATMEQEPELAGESDRVPEPTGPSEAVAEP